FKARVHDVQNPVAGLAAHRIEILEGELEAGASLSAQVDSEHRYQAQQAHSATHMIHAALREVLGETATQAGSLNQPGYLRFDYSYPEAMTAKMRAEVEEAANLAVRNN
ncbi:alanine--tRNA ligase, partial [Brevibacterium paucivorans]